MAEEGRAAVLPPERHEADLRRAGRSGVVGQGGFQIRRLGRSKFRAAGFRAVPGAIVRRSAFIAKGAVLLPSFVNVGARVGEGTMIDTWATVGSCAQVGAHCHISGGAGLGGVLEPLQAAPTIIEDNCFIGARAEVAEGVIVGEGSVLHGRLSVGSTKISTAPQAKCIWARCRPIRWWCRGLCRQAMAPIFTVP